MDERALVQIEGDSLLTKMVRMALESAPGFRGSPLQERTTPVDLSIAMSSSQMRRFEPELLEGKEVLQRRKPPSLTQEGLTSSIASMWAHLLVHYLPELDESGAYVLEQAYGILKELIFLASYWRSGHASSIVAAESIVPRLLSAVRDEASQWRDAEDVRRKRPLVTASLEPLQALEVAQVLVDTLDAGPVSDIPALTATLRSRVAALGLGGRDVAVQ
jgi:hypothetical protein